MLLCACTFTFAQFRVNPVSSFDKVQNFNNQNTEIINGTSKALPLKAKPAKVISAVNGATTDTVYPMVMSLAYYTVQEGGYMSGHNANGWIQFAEQFELETPGTLNGFIYYPAVIDNKSGNGSVTFKVWADNNGTPGTVLASQVVNMADMQGLSVTDDGTYVTPNNLNLTTPLTNLSKFYLGYEISYANGDTIAMIQTEDLSMYGLPSTSFVDTTGNNAWGNVGDMMGGACISLYLGAMLDMTPTTPFPTIDKVEHNFSNVFNNTTATANFTLTNVGTDGLTITSIDALAAPFSHNIDASINLNNGATHNFTVTFAPTAVGEFTETLTIVTNGGTIEIALTGKGIEPFDGDMDGGAETNVNDFDLTFQGWTQHDLDGGATYGFQGIEFSNSGYTGSYIAFNPSTTEPALTETENPVTAATGERFIACFSAMPDEYVVANNDWLITPKSPVLAADSKFEFKAKTGVIDYGEEEFIVLVSTTNTEVESFTKITTADTDKAPADWATMRYDLSAYAGQQIYVAIQCVSSDKFYLCLDDIAFINGDLRTSLDIDDAEQFMVVSNDNNILIGGVLATNITIFDLNGRIVETAQNTQSINVANIQNGIYIIKVTDNENNINTAKVVIK